MTDYRFLQPIVDPSLVPSLKSLITDVVDKAHHRKIDWLVWNHWIAVPVESGSHFDEDDAETLSQAIQTYRAGKLLCSRTAS